jgi:hypothetical protein
MDESYRAWKRAEEIYEAALRNYEMAFAAIDEALKTGGTPSDQQLRTESSAAEAVTNAKMWLRLVAP